MSRRHFTSLSFVIPLFNEQDNVTELFRRLVKTAKLLRQTFEVIAVNDGSTDLTEKKLRQIQKHTRNVKIINLSRNFGHEAAVTAGLEHATGKIVALLDGDLQDEPEFIPKMLAKLNEGYDVVFAVHPRRHDDFARKVGFKLFYKSMDKLTSYKFPLDAGAFSVMRRPVVNSLISLSERNRYIAGLRSWVGFKQVGLDYEKKQRFAGKPAQTYRRLLKMGLDALFSFSYLPLKLATFMGLFVMLGALVGIVDVFVEKFYTHTAVIGWSGPMLSILITGGVQLFILGIVGEYLARIYDEVKRRPYYIISEKVGF